MDHEFVLYRGDHGQFFALDRRCSHRHAALEQGQIESENCIRCPYHGWLYQADGICREIPSNRPGMKIPMHAHIKSYPVQEKYGLVWLFLGNEKSENTISPIPHLPQLSQSGWHSIHGEYYWDSHYTQVIANQVDPMHLGFVHSTSISDSSITQKEYELEEKEWSVSITSKTLSRTKKLPFGLKWLMGENTPSSMFRGTFYLPNLVYSEFIYSHMKLSLFTSNIPISSTQTVTKWSLARDFVTTPFVDPIISRALSKVFDEDNSVVKNLPPGPWPDNMSSEVHVHSDALELAVRKYFRQAMHLNSGD
jgi:phenylpropionate dioxygenase-like ring-hydroxylating dioxygenase large terminal subunit